MNKRAKCPVCRLTIPVIDGVLAEHQISRLGGQLRVCPGSGMLVQPVTRISRQ